jgi:hypothetical protein
MADVSWDKDPWGRGGQQLLGAVAEVVSIAAVHIVISVEAESTFDASSVFPADWSLSEPSTGSALLVGALSRDCSCWRALISSD